LRLTCTLALCIGSLVGSLVISAAPLGAQDLRIVADSVLSGSRVEAHVGDRIDLQIVADLGAISTTGLSLHLSVPDSLFEVVDAKPAAPGVTPFTPGSLFSGFALRNTVLPESDPVAAATPGWQLDYAVVLAPGPGPRGPNHGHRCGGHLQSALSRADRGCSYCL